MDRIEEIKNLLYCLGDVKLETPITVKMSPHTHPTKIYSVSLTEDFTKYTQNELTSIYQRLRLLKILKHEKTS